MSVSTQSAARPLNWAALIEAILLGSTAAMLLAKQWSGTLIYYVHPRYAPLIVACASVLLLIAAARLGAFIRQPAGSSYLPRWRHGLLALPLLLGTLMPARPLGAEALSGALFDAGNAPEPAALDDDTSQWNLLQWVIALSVRGQELQGRPADVIGFVYHDPQRPLDGFFVVRYVVTCCTADSNGAGLAVKWPGGKTIPAGSWVRVRGVLASIILDDRDEPAVEATSIEPVPQPANPYIYP